ncbi:MAG: WecB/TagA/CpsF family glycosyltransferase [Agathobacter sp.]|nr:WecB/TagA/CpsF family glycosyltransferase [Agathobacter sp.]
MNKKIDIAGLQLDNCTVRESIMLLERAMSEQSFFSIAEINMDTILRAETDERVKEAVQRLNHTIIAEENILRAVDYCTMQRQHEIADGTFFYELMKRVERNHLSVCLLGETQDATLSMQSLILERFPRMNIVDVEILEQCTGELDNVINEINIKTPDVVVSLLPSPEQEYFFLDYRDKIFAKLWYAMGTEKPAEHKSRIAAFFNEKKRLRILLRHLTKYQEQEASKDE